VLNALLPAAHWIEDTSLAVLVRESLYGFPTLVAIHIVSLTLSVGLLVWFDLRLLGVVWRDTPVSTVYRRLIPWAAVGFGLMLASGGILFTGYAAAAIGNTAFRIKMSALVVAGLNALFYHRITERHIAGWDTAGTPPLPARMAGLISIVAWATVIFAGRMISYTLY
jgi:hypothetical protein